MRESPQREREGHRLCLLLALIPLEFSGWLHLTRGLLAPPLCLWSHFVTVALWEGDHCPHLADKETEFKAVKNLPPVTQLGRGKGGVWRQTAVASQHTSVNTATLMRPLGWTEMAARQV